MSRNSESHESELSWGGREMPKYLYSVRKIKRWSWSVVICKHWPLTLFWFLFIFLDRTSLCNSSGCPGSSYRLGWSWDLPASASRPLGCVPPHPLHSIVLLYILPPLIPALRKQRQEDLWVPGQPRFHRETLSQQNKTKQTKRNFFCHTSVKLSIPVLETVLQH